MNQKQKDALNSVKRVNERLFTLFRNEPAVTHYRVTSCCNGFYVEDVDTGEEHCLGDGIEVTLAIGRVAFTLDTPGLDDGGDDFAELWTWSFNRDPEAQEACFG